MKDITKIITESVTNGDKNYVQRAVSQILGEDISVGQTVACVEDPIQGMGSGTKGKVKSINSSNSGFATVAMENGTELQLQTSLLVPI